MKKIILCAFAITFLTQNALASETQKDYGKLCEDLGGQHMILESFPVQEKCRVGDDTISIESFQDKYRHYIDGLMIHYATEFKYSDSKKWTNYLEFAAQDNADLEAFSHLKLDAKVKEQIASDLKVQIGLYNFMSQREVLGEEIATKIDEILTAYESKVPETKLQAVYTKLSQKLQEKITQMENFQMTARFTQEGYKKFTFKLNVYKYMLSLVKGRME